jgi:hypothetical protein
MEEWAKIAPKRVNPWHLLIIRAKKGRLGLFDKDGETSIWNWIPMCISLQHWVDVDDSKQMFKKSQTFSKSRGS